MFKPMLAPNDVVDPKNMSYPLLASFKLDGIRCIFYKGQMLSRSLKDIQNKQLREKFAKVIQYTVDNDVLLDGEIYDPELSFQEITRYVMTKDFTDPKTISKFCCVLKIPKSIKFHAFDILTNENYDKDFFKRILDLKKAGDVFPDLINVLTQFNVRNVQEVEDLFDIAINAGEEGLILKNPFGRYKCGRGTVKEGLVYKMKPFETFDAKIIDVVQATKVDPRADKTINELGRSVTSKKQDDRVLIGKASAFKVLYEGKELKVVIAMTDDDKSNIWEDRDLYLGRTIEYKGMLIGAKDVPRHPVMIRFREDK